MAIKLIDEIEPANDGTFPLLKAKHIKMPDGSRLSDQYSIKEVYELPDDAADHPRRLYVITEDASRSVEESNSETPPTDGGDAP